MIRSRSVLLVAGILFHLLTGGAAALAQASDSTLSATDDLQNRFRDVASELRCPTCVGLSVLESDAPFSKQIKDEVMSQLKAGKSDDQVLDFFTERYGPWILRVPPKTGINALAWAVPLGVLLAGPMLVWFFVWRRRENLAGVEAVKPLNELLGDLERDLAEARGRKKGANP
jgi:cytochrome c-type biogenesis protein CcmH